VKPVFNRFEEASALLATALVDLLGMKSREAVKLMSGPIADALSEEDAGRFLNALRFLSTDLP
jgi:hypothetical protein